MYLCSRSSWIEFSTSWGKRTQTWWLERRGSLWWSLPRWSEWEPRKPPLLTSQTSANCERCSVVFHTATSSSSEIHLWTASCAFRCRLHRQPKHLLAFLLAELGTRSVSVISVEMPFVLHLDWDSCNSIRWQTLRFISFSWRHHSFLLGWKYDCFCCVLVISTVAP